MCVYIYIYIYIYLVSNFELILNRSQSDFEVILNTF